MMLSALSLGALKVPALVSQAKARVQRLFRNDRMEELLVTPETETLQLLTSNIEIDRALSVSFSSVTPETTKCCPKL